MTSSVEERRFIAEDLFVTISAAAAPGLAQKHWDEAKDLFGKFLVALMDDMVERVAEKVLDTGLGAKPLDTPIEKGV